MVFSTRLKELRDDKNISRQAVADAVGVSVRTISFWENNVNEPKASYIIKLADFFGVSTDYLLGRED